MTDLSVEIIDIDEVLVKAKVLLKPDVWRKALTHAGLEVLGEVQERTPVDTGRLRSSITVKVDPAPFPLWVKVGTGVHYSRPVEFGTGLLSEAPDSKHRRYFPPPQALSPWARRHGMSGQSAGFLVARSIWRRGGTKPRRMFREGLQAALGRVEQILNRAAREMLSWWSA